ncbi:hypothetical protein D3Y59_15500 [Hymenobacter oligotrophus]|uniref:DUF6799 domain-containing protein n=1 Tax=Hymenobacter oligotrophus TaxID=2319843 RepID=A0A3B7R3K6_9BACT|nr:DUF6799 domain-containing protein [Hymenobacter oligotrophus]AYA38322.1 hypothetical protein D3Y59_15500 [Hymenobacter oligotrophus]
MKRFVLLFLLCCATLVSVAQTATALKDGAYRRNGVVMRLKAGKATRLQAPLALSDGSVINPSGLLVRKDGTRQQLPEGQAVNMQGVVVNFRDDMRTPQAIERQSVQVTGSTGETRVSVPGTPVSAATAQQLKQLERRVALLQQATDKLAERTALGAAAVPNGTRYDQQLRTLDAQLKR